MANILVVDQYLSIGLLYREVLQDEGHRVFVALSGKEALDFALHQRLDMAIVDDTLADFSAEELFEELKRLQYRLKGIVIVSTDFDPEHDARLWDGIFVKTNNFTLLEAEVERLRQES
jgi:DNA-binding response OmpR family regulator